MQKLLRVQPMYTMTPMYPMYKDRHMEKSKRVMRHIKLVSMNRRLLWMHLEKIKWFRLHSMYPMYPMYKDRHMEKSKRFMRHIKLISMNRKLFWMSLEVYEVVEVAFHVLYDAYPISHLFRGHFQSY
jgi:hypothetical protein